MSDPDDLATGAWRDIFDDTVRVDGAGTFGATAFASAPYSAQYSAQLRVVDDDTAWTDINTIPTVP